MLSAWANVETDGEIMRPRIILRIVIHSSFVILFISIRFYHTLSTLDSIDFKNFLALSISSLVALPV